MYFVNMCENTKKKSIFVNRKSIHYVVKKKPTKKTTIHKITKFPFSLLFSSYLSTLSLTN